MNAQIRLDEQAVASGRLSCLAAHFIWDSLLLWATSALTSFARTGRELFVRQPLEIPIQTIAIERYRKENCRASDKGVIDVKGHY